MEQLVYKRQAGNTIGGRVRRLDENCEAVYDDRKPEMDKLFNSCHLLHRAALFSPHGCLFIVSLQILLFLISHAVNPEEAQFYGGSLFPLHAKRELFEIQLLCS